MHQLIVQWLKLQLQTTKQKGFVIGVSGGIDSAVTSTLCALTGAPVIAVSMPIHQAKTENSRAERHLQWLTERYPNVQVTIADLTPIFDTYREQIHSITEDDLVAANLRSRLRMTTLYALANAHGYLVVGTGNKVEDYGIGFFTKYGDGGVDISPIGDLYKSEVREIGRQLEINNEIIEAAPTDGLWSDGRTDEDQIGASYDELEFAMKWLSNSVTATLTPRQQEVLSIYLKRHVANQHKMKMPPVCKIERGFV